VHAHLCLGVCMYFLCFSLAFFPPLFTCFVLFTFVSFCFSLFKKNMPVSLFLFFLFLKKIYFIYYIYKYTVAVFRYTGRGHRISLQTVVNHHVVAGN